MLISLRPKITVDSGRFQSYGFCAMETSNTVTRRQKRSSNRTAADSQPIPGSHPPSGEDARQLGLNDATKVVQWLNAAKGAASYERVVQIRSELEELPRDFARNAAAYVHVSGRRTQFGIANNEDWPQKKLKVQRQLHNRHAALNEAFHKYVFRPRATYVLAARAWVFGMVPDENKRWFQMKIGYQTISEADAVISLVRLAETGDLGKVRLCEMCKERWRVAAKRSYRFCSDECRETFYAKAPDYHSRKAANQRRYRESVKRIQAAHGGRL
jgi:hypothetical protein